MLEKIVKRLVGVEDAPKWLEREVYDRAQRDGVDIESVVNYLAPWLLEIYRGNLVKYRPGRHVIRKAAPYLVAELIQQSGFQVAFINLFGEILPAAVRGEGTYTPVLLFMDAKKKSLYLASKSRKIMKNVVQLTATGEIDGIIAEIVKIERPPYYYLTTRADLRRHIEGSVPITATPSPRYNAIYYYWRYFRERGYLVLVGKEVGGVAVELLAVGIGKYAVVSRHSKKIARLKKLLDGIYLV